VDFTCDPRPDGAWQQKDELPLDDLAMMVMPNVWRAAHACKCHMERAVLRQHDLSFASFYMLLMIRIWEPIESRDLRALQELSGGTVTSTLNLLQRRMLVRRRTSQVDRRLVRVRLTPEGKALIDSVFPAFGHVDQRTASHLSGKEQQTLIRLLDKLRAGIQEDNGKGTPLPHSPAVVVRTHRQHERAQPEGAPAVADGDHPLAQ
jgi:MarR family transcriptional regulator, organic hydroperoxide resistance regulator